MNKNKQSYPYVLSLKVSYPQNIGGTFLIDFDKDNNMIIYSTKDHKWGEHPPSIKDKDYCRACK